MEKIGRAVERLLTDETLTADVDDDAAQALLRWGQEQLAAGRPEAQVQRGVRAMGTVVAQRASLDPAAARARLETAGLAADGGALAGLLAEDSPEGEWAERLLQALTPTPLPPSPSPAQRERGRGEATTGGRGERVRAAAPFSFEIVAEDTHSAARAGVLHTPHGDIPTPVYMPVGTRATVKTVTPDELRAAGAAIILGNTYHLYLRPGAGVVAEMGGLHRFMGWERPLLTDSGGFQVFSLAANRTIAEEGVTFRSHIDGSLHLFTPEAVVAIEEQLGADIMMPLDECVPYPCPREYAAEALGRTHRWAERARRAQSRPDQALFGIVQGSTYADLRRQSAATLAALDFPGYAIGGLSVGEPKAEMHAMLESSVPFLPRGRPRHLLGVGSPEDFFEGIARGVDMFDCVLATRIARHGALLVPAGRLNIRNAQHERDPRPIQEGCTCYTCRRFSRAYLRHLFQTEELLGLRLATLHNLHFLLDLLARIRASILDGTFMSLRQEFLSGFTAVPEEVRREEAARRRQGRD